MSPVLLLEHPHPGVALLRLNRPAVLNALNLELRRALATHITQLDADPEVKAIVLAGSDKAFCAGADLGEYVDATPAELMARRHDLLWGALAQCRKPLIAAVRGHALGGGCELALHADLIIAGESARFGQPEVKVGIMPGGGATQRLTRTLGKHAAMQMLLWGEPISAQQALNWRLVAEVLPDADTEARAIALASALCQMPSVALRLLKESVLAALETPLNAGLEYERQAFQACFATEDKHEGMRARLDKRPAQFKGR